MEALCPYYWVRPKARLGDGEAGAQLPVTARMKAATEELHEVADKLVVARLALVLADARLYGGALCAFYVVFEHLAAVWAQASPREPSVARLRPFAQVLVTGRVLAFERDLALFLGPSWRQRHEPIARAQPAVRAYIDHLNALVRRGGALLLVPYIYHLGLALLAGGQVIRKMVRTAFALPRHAHGHGTAVFEFPEVEHRGTFKREFKAAVDELDIDAGLAASFFRESPECFRLNNRVVDCFGRTGLGRQLLIAAQSLWLHGFLAVAVAALAVAQAR